MNRESITAIIPAYNEAARIGRTIREVANMVDEVIVIDDGSEDETAAKAIKAGARVIHHDQNLGYIAAIKTGFQNASGEIVITIDADGEMPVEKVTELVQPILENKAEMVQGTREQIPRLSERLINWIASQKTTVGDSGTGFRALRTSLARQLTLNGVCICGIFSMEVISRAGRIAEIPVQMRTVTKPRRIAWYHLVQLFYLFPWLFRGYNNAILLYGGEK